MKIIFMQIKCGIKINVMMALQVSYSTLFQCSWFKLGCRVKYEKNKLDLRSDIEKQINVSKMG